MWWVLQKGKIGCTDVPNRDYNLIWGVQGSPAWGTNLQSEALKWELQEGQQLGGKEVIEWESVPSINGLEKQQYSMF